MSVREEDRQKNCPSRGLGLAAAAIGVGVGAALYYFFSKSPEQPASGGSTSSNWSSEEAQALSEDTSSLDSSSSDTTSDEISDEMSTENNISDCSSSNTEESSSHEDLTANMSSDSLSTSSDTSSQSESNESLMFSSSSTSTDDSMEMLSDHTRTPNNSTSNRLETSHTPHRLNESIEHNSANTPPRNSSLLNIFRTQSVDSDIDTRDWDVTNSLLGLPDANDSSLSPSALIRIYEDIISQYSLFLTGSNSRERPRTVEDCSICFEPMQRDQQLLSLACTHHFHAACIRPWLDEQNTCPNCRKYAAV